MRTRTRAAIGVVLIAAVAGTLWMRGGPAPRPAASAATAAVKGARVSWPTGKRFLYSVSWQAKTGGEIAPGTDGRSSQAIALESAVDGEIALERVAAPGKHAVVALNWTKLDKFSFGMQGQDAQGDKEQAAKALVGQTAFLDIDERGRIGDIAFAAEMNASARGILRSLALELRYTLPNGETPEWEAVERDSLGEAQVKYRAGLHELARETIRYDQLDAVPGALDGKQELHGGSILALDANGVPLSIEESIGASYTRPQGTAPAVRSTWMFSLHRTGESAASGVALAARMQSQPLGAQVDDPEREKRMDQRLAEGMSFDTMLLGFDRFEGGSKADRQFLVKAAAWLRLHPGDVPPMVAKFRSKDLTVRGRGLILDVLATTGTPLAQRAMREALSSDAARAKAMDFSILVQRFTFVLAPEQESIDFLEKSAQSGEMASAQGAVVALGSAVRRLDQQLDHDKARQVNEKLRDELRNARTPEMRGALVAALGNAARTEDVPDLVAVAGDPDPRVRDQVATALRSVDSPDARAGLMTLATDHSSAVAIHALDSLQKQSLEDQDWRALSKLDTQPAADSAMVSLVREKGPQRAEGREILTRLLKRNQGGDSDLGVIIRSVLKQG